MTEEQKDILIAKMLDAPSSLSDKELESILSDEELRDIYEMSVAVSGAYIPQPDFDMADEWTRFRPNIHRKPMPMRWAMRVAAIFLGVVLVAGVLVRVIDKMIDAPRATVAKVQETQKSVEIKSNEENINANVVRKEEDSQSLIPRSKETSSGQHMSPTKTMKKKQMELPEEEIDVDEYLRIQQSEIDWEIALLNGEMYLDEWDAMREFFGYINGENMGEAETNIIIL